MRFLRGIPKSAWVIGGLIAGLVIAPTAAVAATAMIVHGANGPAVNATTDNQMLTAEAPPSAWASVYGWAFLVGQCSNLPTANAVGGFVVRQVNVDIEVNARSGTGGTALLFEGAGCKAGHLFAQADAVQGTVVLPFTPGIALPKNGTISILFEGAAAGIEVHVHGYRVPASDVPAYTPVITCSHAASACD
jgi:hypothetical protein